MTKGVRTLYSDENLILVTTKGAENISVDEQFFDFSYALEPKKFLRDPTVPTKFAELYKTGQDKTQKQIFLPKSSCEDTRDHNIINSYLYQHNMTMNMEQPYQE